MKAKKTPTLNRAEMLVCKKRFGLNEDLQMKIKSVYRDYKDLMQLTKDVCNDPVLTEDSEQFKNIKGYVARLHKGVEMYDFTEDQVNYIADNGETTRPADLARIVFPDITGPMIREIRAVSLLLDALDIKYKKDFTEDAVILAAYEPAATDHKIVAMINKADPEAKLTISALDSDKRKRIAFLKRHVNSPRFLAMINGIRDRNHREVFEIEFVRSVSDKPDLNIEEVNGYLNLANEYVLSLQITEQMADLNDRLKEATDDTDEGKKYTKNISDSLNTKVREFDACQGRMKELHSHLAGKRSDRIKNAVAMNESLTKFVELAKSEEGRKYMLKLAAIRNEEIKKECARIENLSDLAAEVWGVSVEEIIKFNT